MMNSMMMQSDAGNCKKEGVAPAHVLYTFMKIKYFFHIVFIISS